MILDPAKIWIFPSLHSFGQTMSGFQDAPEPVAIEPGSRMQCPEEWGNRPPVIAATSGVIEDAYPKLEGRFRQPLPRAFSMKSRSLVQDKPAVFPNSQSEKWHVWLIPWRVGSDRTIVITVRPGTVLNLNVSHWPERSETGGDERPQTKFLQRAGHFLASAPGVFATTPSINAAYRRLEELWGEDQDKNPQQDTLKKHAIRLQSVLENLLGRPRVVLRSEHCMQKLQDVRRMDAKSLRWLSAQPGRNTLERAGARQQIKAPKREKTVDTLENRVLRAFAALTVQETDKWLKKNTRSNIRQLIQAHQSRARRIERFLKESRIRAAIFPVVPNFPLRFDPRYREIWRAWEELRNLTSRLESEWMWQERTWMELLGLRAAMTLQKRGGAILSHAPVLAAEDQPNQGRFLKYGGVDFVIGTACNNGMKTISFHSGDHVSKLGAIADAKHEEMIWWVPCSRPDGDECDHLPWTPCCLWTESVSEWVDSILA